MKVLFVQITDIHFRGDKPIDLNRSLMVGDAIGNAYAFPPDAIIMIYSGDLVWSGKEEDYEKVGEHLTNLETSIARIFGKAKVFRVMCPGNHDCHFSTNEVVRSLVVQSAIKSGEFHGPLYEEAIGVHDNYFEFAESFEAAFSARKPLWSSADRRLGWQNIVDLEAAKLNFICLNSAWLSLKHEDPGTIHFPGEEFLPEEGGCELTVGVLHHPLSWMHPETAHRVRQSLLHRCDLVFSGHEHSSLALNLREELNNFEVKLFEGSAYSDHVSPINDGFTTVLIDLKNLSSSSRSFIWRTGGYVVQVGQQKYDPAKDKDYEVLLARKAKNGAFPRFAKNFDEWLEDPGLPLFNSERTSILFSEIYTFPETRSLRVQGAPGLTKIIGDTQELLNLGYGVVLGATNSGKTSMAKDICRRSISAGLLPLYIDSRKLKAHQSNFSSYIQKNIEEQYGESTEDFGKRPQTEKVVILDDFHSFASKVNINKVEELLALLKIRFGRLFIFGSDIEFGPSDFASIFQGSSWGIPTGIQILPFSLRKRNELLWRWLRLNPQLNDAELNARAVEINRKLDIIIGRNFVQPFPPYLLAVMQGVESGREIDLSTSTHGHFYEIFIKSCLAKKATSTNYNIFSNFLGMLAYRAFTEEVSVMSDDFFANVHRDFEDEYDLSRPLEVLKYNLMEIGLLAKINGCYCFAEKFVVYYFTAYYIKDRLSDPVIRQSVSEMADKLWVEDYANVMLFVVHLTKDHFVVGEITARIAAMFSTSQEANLSDDIKFLANYGNDVIDISVSKKFDREEQLTELSHAQTEALMPEYAAAPARNVAAANVDEVAKFNAALKAMQLLGQVLKNFPASFKGDQKQEMAMKCMQLGLRCLGFYFDLVQQDEKQVLAEVSEMLVPKNKNATDAEKRESAKAFVQWMCRHMAFAIIKRISYSIGSQELTKTYEKIFSQCVTDAHKLIELSLMLDHQGDFPESRVKQRFLDWDKKNVFAANQLKMLVSRNWKLFDLAPAIKQSTADVIGIELTAEHIGGSGSKIIQRKSK